MKRPICRAMLPLEGSFMKAVILLGAGASAPFGVPTLRDIFKDPQARLQLRKDTALHGTLQDVFWGPRGRDLESSNETLTVEDMLTITRDYELCPSGVVPPLLPDIADFRRRLYVLIKRAVYDLKSSTGRHLNELIKFARTNFEQTTWASFNWDCIFEASYYYSSSIDRMNRSNPQVLIGLRNWNNLRPSRNKFLKLHGGVNWWFENDGILYLPFGSRPDLRERWEAYEAGTAAGHPVLLEPSSHKYNDPVYKLLEPQWEFLIRELTQADRVVIVGYSLPEGDAMARTALAVGFQSGPPDARWIVVNRNANVCNRYQQLFGTRKVKTLTITLTDFSANLAENLEVPTAAGPGPAAAAPAAPATS